MLKRFFNRKKIADLVINELVGKFVGFVVGMWCTKMFTKTVYEKKTFMHTIGLAKRKKYVVSTMPEWAQGLIAIIVGFIVLELISYFFEHKLYMKIYYYFKGLIFKKNSSKELNETENLSVGSDA